MSEHLEIDFPVWDDTKHVLLYRLSNSAAYAILNNAVEVSHAGNNKERDRDKMGREVIEGIYSLLASSVEYLRWFGESSEDIKHGVRRIIKKFRETPAAREVLAQNVLLIREISDVNQKAGIVVVEEKIGR